MAEKGEAGKVLIGVRISGKQITEAGVIHSSGYQELDHAARRPVRYGKIFGKPQPNTEYYQLVNFNPDD